MLVALYTLSNILKKEYYYPKNRHQYPFLQTKKWGLRVLENSPKSHKKKNDIKAKIQVPFNSKSHVIFTMFYLIEKRLSFDENIITNTTNVSNHLVWSSYSSCKKLM